MCDNIQEQKMIRINRLFVRVVLAILLPQYHGEVARSGELHAGCAQAHMHSRRIAKRQRWSDRLELLPNLPMNIFQHDTLSAAGVASTSGRSVQQQKIL
jgi:hypothetical protein